ncbi:uncharacterized protein [Centruroides vittatus]|uniref:uncharacterized protein n=1 Tax=Centruroides vittatus TaxID=120091 RepID=UPI00350FF660
MNKFVLKQDIDKSKIIVANNTSDNNNNEADLIVFNRIIKDNEKILSESDGYDLLVSFWNVQGLRGKLQNYSVREFLDSNDIIGITETWLLNLSSAEKNILSQNHSIINSNAQRKSKFGRPARGISLLIKKSLGDILYQYISEYFIVAIIKVDSNIKSRWNYLYLGLIVIYLPPALDKRSVLRIVQNYIERWSFLVQQWIIGGDFNARIGENIDTEFFQNFDNISGSRSSKDKLLNMDGKVLLDFVQDSQLLILNGRLKGDIPAEFTFVSPNGKSTVDYVICSECMIDYCESLSVLENDLSDHFPIQLVLKYYKDIRREKRIEKEHTLSNDFKPSYNKQKLLNEFQKIIEDMLSLEEDNQPVANYLRLTTKLEEYRFGKCLSPYKQIYKCDWYDNTCYIQKIKKQKSLKVFRKTNTKESLMKYLQNKRIYINLIKAKKKKYFSNISKILTESRDTRVFWSTINGFRKKKSDYRAYTRIEHDKWIEYFQEFSENYLLNYNQTQKVYKLSQVTNHSELIKAEEVQNRIKKLKDKSTPGPDKIPNSLIKLLPLELITYVTK